MRQSKKINESGRSIVEMLGVLAIIGVLSVAGIAGYTTAMNHHRANAALNTALRFATIVSGQRLLKPDARLSESDLTGTQFTMESDTDKIVLKLSNVSPRVVAKLITMEIKGGRINEENGTVIFTFNNDMSEEEGPATECSGHGYKNTNDDCVCNPGYSGTNCDSFACNAGETYCGSGAGGTGKTEACCNPNATNAEVCSTAGDEAGTCVAKAGNLACTTNASCIEQTVETTICTSENCYCNLENTNYYGNAPDRGTCAILEDGNPITYTHGGKSKELLEGKVGQMSWWEADNWCKAHDMSLIKASTLGCSVNGSSITCPDQIYEDMLSSGLSQAYWTANSSGCCSAWQVWVNGGWYTQYSTSDRYGQGYALCE